MQKYIKQTHNSLKERKREKEKEKKKEPLS